MKKIVLATMVGATLLAGCASEDTTKVEKNTQPAQKEEKKEKKAYVGDTVTIDNIKVTISQMEKKSQIGDSEYPTKAKGEYLMFNITVENKSKETFTTSDADFALYVNKAKHDASSDVYELNDAFTGGDISPDTRIENKKIMFDVKKGANLKGAYIEFKPNMFMDKSVKIYLK